MSTQYLYLDIETIPGQKPGLKEEIAAGIKPPASMKKAETIAAWESSDKADAVETAYRKLSFDGVLGHCVSVAWAINGGDVASLAVMKNSWGECEDESDPLGDYHMMLTDEELYLEEFFLDVSKRIDPTRKLVIVGHNISFDLRFLLQCAVTLGIFLPRWFTRNVKPWPNDVFDTMTAWAGEKEHIGLDRLSMALDLPGKDEGMDGSQVYDDWIVGNIRDICAYNRVDVMRIRNVHQKVMVAFGEDYASAEVL